MLAWGWPLRASLSRALAAALLVTALSLARGEQENTGTAHWMRAADERLEWFARNWKNLLGDFLDRHSQEVLPGRTVGDVLTDAARKGALTLSALERMALLEAEGTAHRAGVSECPFYADPNVPDASPQVCNGDKKGECQGGECKCKGGWSGIACQTEPALGCLQNSGSTECTKPCEEKVKAVGEQCA